MVTQRIVLLSALVFYLCVVVKERAEPCHQGHYTPVICFGKLFSQVAFKFARLLPLGRIRRGIFRRAKNGGRDWT